MKYADFTWRGWSLMDSFLLGCVLGLVLSIIGVTL